MNVHVKWLQCGWKHECEKVINIESKKNSYYITCYESATLSRAICVLQGYYNLNRLGASVQLSRALTGFCAVSVIRFAGISTLWG